MLGFNSGGVVINSMIMELPTEGRTLLVFLPGGGGLFTSFVTNLGDPVRELFSGFRRGAIHEPLRACCIRYSLGGAILSACLR